MSTDDPMKAILPLTFALKDIITERAAQDDKWGLQNHFPLEWVSILTEEVGEVAQAANKAQWNNGRLADYRTELIQVAAVAVAALECLYRHAEAV